MANRSERTKSQNGKRSRAKGVAFERWVVRELQRIGLPAERNIAQSRTAAREGCDVEGSPWWIECKVGANPSYEAAFLQAVGDQNTQAISARVRDVRPIVVVWRKDRHEAMATFGADETARWCRHVDGDAAVWAPDAAPLVTMRFADWLTLVTP